MSSVKKSLNESFEKFTSEFIFKKTSSELIDVKMNYDNFIFLMSSLLNLALLNLLLRV